MSHHTALRPIERRIRRLADEGVDEVEIAWRFRRSPRFVRQVLELVDVPRRPGNGKDETTAGPTQLRPLERRLLWWRSQGLDHDELAPRFRRSPEFLRRVEAMARYKLAGRLAG